VKKAQHLVLQALRTLELRSGSPLGFRVTLVGDGPLRSTLEAMVREFGWESRVRFLGHVPHASALLVETYRMPTSTRYPA